MNKSLLISTFLLAVVTAHAQQSPDFSFEVSPASLFGSTRSTPQDTCTRGYSLQPKLDVFARVHQNLSLGVHIDYDYTGGEIFEDYTRLSLAPSLRYNLGKKSSTSQTFEHQPRFLNRLLLSAEAGYFIKAFESDQELNRGRFSGDGLYWAVNIGVALTRKFGISYKIIASEAGPTLNSNFKIGHEIYAVVPLLRDRDKLPLIDPERDRNILTRDLVRERTRRAREAAAARLPKNHRSFVELNYGWAPAPEQLDDSMPSYRNDLYTYGLGVGLNGLLDRRLEVSIQVNRVLSAGSFLDPDDRSTDRYLTYGAEARYRFNLPSKYFDILAGARLFGSDYCTCGEDDGYTKPGNVFGGVTGTVRFMPAEWLWVDASLSLNHLFNDVPDKFGYNYPNLRLGVPIGKVKRR